MTKRPASESETTALSQQPDDKVEAPAPAEKPQGLRIADIAGDIVFIELEDGRHVAGVVEDGVEGVKRHARVEFTSEGEDKSGAPTGVRVTKVLS